MPRRFFRKFLPDHETVRSHKYLAWMDTWGGGLHHPNLWHLNRHSVAGGFAIGLFSGLVPGPLQMLTAGLLAIALKKNLPVALVTTLYTNPLTIAPLYLLAYGYGRVLMGVSHHPVLVQTAEFEWDWAHWLDSCEAMIHWMISLGQPLAIGLVALALTLALVGYFAVQWGWRLYVTLAWRARARHRAARTA